MAKLNIKILRISELKWTGMGQFNSDNHYVYYYGQESFRRNEVALTVNKSPKCSTWVQPQVQNDLSSFPRQTIQPHCDPSLCPNHWCQRSWSWQVLWRRTTPSRINTKKRCPSHHRGLECKRRKSKDTWNNRQVWPWSTKWRRARGKRTCWSYQTCFSNSPRDASICGHHQMVSTKVRLIMLSVAKDGEAQYSQQKQDVELTVAQITDSLLQNLG